MNDELEIMWKETVVALSRYYPGIFLEGLREITKHFSQDSLCPGRALE
jgi:hypothetical protein